jgi:hypothetical protein
MYLKKFKATTQNKTHPCPRLPAPSLVGEVYFFRKEINSDIKSELKKTQ